MKWKWLFPVASILAVAGPSASAQDLATAEEHISAWRAIDETWQQGVTIRGTHEVPRNPLDQDIPPYLVRFELTTAGAQVAVREVTESVHEVAAAIAANRKRRLEIEGEPLGQAVAKAPIGVVSSVSTIFDRTRSKQSRWLAVFSVDKTTGEMKPEGPSAVSELHRPDSEAFLLSHLGVIWIAGRGFASHISDVASAVPEGEAIRVQGSGAGLSGHFGQWEMIIEPRQGYLVRRAVFIPGEKGGLRLEIVNTDLAVKDAVAHPKRGTLAIGPPGFEMVHQYIIDDVALSFSDDVYSNIAKEVDSPLPDGSMVIDETRGAAQSHIVGQPNQDAAGPAVLAIGSRLTTVLLLLAANLAAILIVAVLLIRRSRSHRNSG